MWRRTYRPVRHNVRLLGGSVSRRGVLLAALGNARVLLGARAGMFVSLNGSLVGRDSPAFEWPGFARLAARVGYGGVDLNLQAAMKEGVEATRSLFSELKIKPGFSGFPGSPFGREEAAFQSSLSKLPEAAQFCAAIGCPRMMVVMPPSSQTPKPELRKIAKERLMAVSAILLRSKVRLGLEFLGPQYMRTRQPHEFIWRMDEALEFAKECGPNIGLVLDAWHWHHSGATLDDIVRAGKSRIVTVYVSDAKKQPPEDVRDNQRLLPGEGIIDLVGFFRTLQKIGYHDAVSPEPLGRISKDTPPEEGARMGLQSTLAVMRKAGVA
jgi:sugar phosphate isomerase/epimerase